MARIRDSYRFSSVQETKALGGALGQTAQAGNVLALRGALGAGKTCLVQGLARGLGVPETVPVVSPTFTLVNEYEGRLPLYHIDLYRLTRTEELGDLGYEEYLYGQGVCAVEWIDRFPEAYPKAYLGLEIEVAGARSRLITVEPVGEESQKWWEAAKAHCLLLEHKRTKR